MLHQQLIYRSLACLQETSRLAGESIRPVQIQPTRAGFAFSVAALASLARADPREAIFSASEDIRRCPSESVATQRRILGVWLDSGFSDASMLARSIRLSHVSFIRLGGHGRCKAVGLALRNAYTTRQALGTGGR
jgi:hypothetical protein